ncbi:MAG: ATP-grasp domain-containing protein [Rhizobiales bacterium]|nr:ATP-grasp domain-containing protein [Hyphomicrobiales bacterium]
MKLKSVLIANRGEIACRVARSAHQLGMRVIAVYSEADADALHVRVADEAHLIGPAEAARSYLDATRILEVAKASGAECIHPGYGFLSENAEFADACEAAGIVFVGPGADAIRAMGLKHAAKDLMLKAGVPVVPGYQGDDQSDDHLKAMADETGYPVLIKAVAGGGGKGMRRVDEAAGFADALKSCRREAEAAFGNAQVLIESYVAAPRHIEVQVFADAKGNCGHLYERDCSMQRRHQKVIEEAPAPDMPAKVREKMCAAAVNAAKAVNYRGAGTVEFIADGAKGLRPDGFYFMEMNTRLQVEHPVSEAITGVDLVEWQFRIAAGEPLPLAQKDISITGHAIEARVYAEDPNSGFLPQAGKLNVLKWPAGRPGLRIDTGVEEGAVISAYYDPMIAKMIFHGPTRGDAIAGLAASLAASTVLGLRSNLAFNRRLITETAFIEADFDTSYIDQHLDNLCDAEIPGKALIVAAEAWLQSLKQDAHRTPWSGLTGWSMAGLPRCDWLHLRVNGQDLTVRIDWKEADRHYTVTGDDGDVTGVVSHGVLSPVELACIVDNDSLEADVWADPAGGRVLVSVLDVHLDVTLQDMLNRDEEAGAASASLKAPMSGKIIQMLAEPGQHVAKGEQLAVLEAMKMEHSLKAGFAGTVQSVGAGEGDQVQEGQVVIVLASDEAAG